jgi:hypothetical protein
MPFGTVQAVHIFPQSLGQVAGFYKIEDRGAAREVYNARIMLTDSPRYVSDDLVYYEVEAAKFGIVAKNLQPATAIPVFIRGRFQGYSHVLTSSLSAETLANVVRARAIWKA